MDALRLMSRRRFLGTLSLGGVAIARGRRLTGEADGSIAPSSSEEPPLFRFLQINDVHLQQESGFTSPTYRDANRRARWLVEHLADSEFFPPLDFVLFNGDMIHQGTLESNRGAFAYLRRLLPSMPVPFYPSVGNHEVSQHEGDPLWEAPYVQTYGEGRQFYSVVHKGVAFVIFNNAGTGEGLKESIYRTRYERLQALLQEHADIPTFAVCHIPVYPVRQEEVLARSFGFHSWRTREPEIAHLLEGHPSVNAVLSGHLHLTGIARKTAIPQVVFSGTASYPHDVGLYTVYRDVVRVEAIRLPSDLLVPETNIHGATRHGVDYVDRDHPTYTQYLMGNCDERLFSIRCGGRGPEP